MEIRISAKAFAEFVAGSPSKKSSTVRNILRPKSPEAKIPSGYYKPAIGVIRAYHDRGNDESFVRAQTREMQNEVLSATTSQARAKRSRNLMALDAYMRKFAGRNWKVTSCPRIHYTSHEIRISGMPDLAIRDGSRLRLVKLGVRKEKETQDMIRIMLRVIYQAAKSKIQLMPRDITYFDVATGDAISGDPSDADLATRIDGGCRALRQMIDGRTE